MVYSREYYEKNKDKWKIYHKTQINDPEKHKKLIQNTKQWKIDNPKEAKLQKKKSDAKYHSKKKQDPEYVEHRRLIAEKYNNRPEVKEHRKIIQSKHRAKPEVKKQNAIYNSQWAKNNPDKVLENIQRHMKRLSGKIGISWTMWLSQLKAWSRIIHQDCNETCQVCGDKSTQAHHIFHKSKYPQLAFNRNNGIALCDECHYEVHGKML